MTTTTDTLRTILLDEEKSHVPWTSGVMELDDHLAKLFFVQKDGTARRVDLKSITDADGEALANACTSATFGRGQEDVLDETYRKAGKLDVGDFAWIFGSDTGGITSRLVRGLFPFGTLEKGIRLEMYKLNVYSTGSFFKAHTDTPLGEDMFGSLVIVLPFAHAGGNLVLRHKDKTFDFDAPTLLRDATPGSIAYAAFYSDVEHEVLEVTSGNRVTITFSLYYDQKGAPPAVSPRSSPGPEHPFKLALQNCLQYSNFRRDHPYLGFGLQHAYPVGNAAEYSQLSDSLKGLDITLYRLLTDLGLKPQFKYLYHSDDDSGFGVLLDKPIHDELDGYGDDDERELNHLVGQEGAQIVWYDKASSTSGGYYSWSSIYYENESEWKEKVIPVTWITKPTDNLTGKNMILVYGNQVSVAICYYRVCIVIKVPDSSD